MQKVVDECGWNKRMWDKDELINFLRVMLILSCFFLNLLCEDLSCV